MTWPDVDVKRGVEVRGAVAHVVVGATLGHARGAAAAPAWSRSQGLELGLLVHAQHHRRRQVGSGSSPTMSRTLSMNCGSGDSLKSSTSCGLSPNGPPDPAHRRSATCPWPCAIDRVDQSGTVRRAAGTLRNSTIDESTRQSSRDRSGRLATAAVPTTKADGERRRRRGRGRATAEPFVGLQPRDLRRCTGLSRALGGPPEHDRRHAKSGSACRPT